MPKVCKVTGKKRTTGHNVSHSVRRTKRTFDPNLQTKRIFDPEKGKYVKVRISAKGLKCITKNPKKFLKKLA